MTAAPGVPRRGPSWHATESFASHAWGNIFDVGGQYEASGSSSHATVPPDTASWPLDLEASVMAGWDGQVLPGAKIEAEAAASATSLVLPPETASAYAEDRCII